MAPTAGRLPATQRDTLAPVTDALLIVQRWPATYRRAGPRRHGAARRHGPSGVLGRFSDALGSTRPPGRLTPRQNVSIDMSRPAGPTAEPDKRGIPWPSCPALAGARRTPARHRPPNPTRRIGCRRRSGSGSRPRPPAGSTAYATVVRFCTATWPTSPARPSCGRTFPTRSPKQTYLRRRSTSWSSHIPTPAIQIASTSFRSRRLRRASAIGHYAPQNRSLIDTGTCPRPPVDEQRTCRYVRDRAPRKSYYVSGFGSQICNSG